MNNIRASHQWPNASELKTFHKNWVRTGIYPMICKEIETYESAGCLINALASQIKIFSLCNNPKQYPDQRKVLDTLKKYYLSNQYDTTVQKLLKIYTEDLKGQLPPDATKEPTSVAHLKLIAQSPKMSNYSVNLLIINYSNDEAEHGQPAAKIENCSPDQNPNRRIQLNLVLIQDKRENPQNGRINHFCPVLKGTFDAYQNSKYVHNCILLVRDSNNHFQMLEKSP